MIEFEITAGRLTSLARLLVFMGSNPDIDAGVASQYLVRNRAIQSERLAKNAVDWAVNLRLIESQGGLNLLTPSGESIILGSEELDGVALQRRLLLKAILHTRRDLLWIAHAEPAELKVEIPGLYQILLELRLVERKPSDAASNFWKDIRQAEIRFSDAVLKKIGDSAEALSMKFESQRLSTLGSPALASQIVWLARESDLHGYDILSFRGDGENPRERRHIEVKRARVIKGAELQFHLSRNEYNQAQALGEKYFFHLWWSKADSSEMQLEIIQGAIILELAPTDKDESNFWTECVLTYKPNSQLA